MGMSREQWAGLTHYKQRIKVAKCDGFTNIVPSWRGSLRGERNGRRLEIDVPDYLNDLNACHDMERRMLKSNRMGTCCAIWWRYCEMLMSVVDRGLGTEAHVHAAAAQRCEAFVLTMEGAR